MQNETPVCYRCGEPIEEPGYDGEGACSDCRRLSNLNVWRQVEVRGALVDVHCYRIIGTDCLVVEAFEPLAGHGTQATTADGRRVGRIGTRQLPAALEALAAGSSARLTAIFDWRMAQFGEAHNAIELAFPEFDMVGGRSNGRLEINAPFVSQLALRLAAR